MFLYILEFEICEYKLHQAIKIYNLFFREESYYELKSAELYPLPLYKAIYENDLVKVEEYFDNVKETIEEILLKVIGDSFTVQK